MLYNVRRAEERRCKELYVQCAVILSMFIESPHEIKKTDPFKRNIFVGLKEFICRKKSILISAK